MQDDAEYIQLLTDTVRSLEAAIRAATAAVERGERPAAVVLDFLCRLELAKEYAAQCIPSRWRVN